MAYYHCTDCDSVWEDPEEGKHMTGLTGHYCPECDEVRMMMPHTDIAAEMKTLATMIRETTAARGVDLYAVEERGYSAAEWAEMTDRDRSTVARNVRRANETTQGKHMSENNQMHGLESGDVLIDTSADENTPIKIDTVHGDGSVTIHVFRSETYWDEETHDGEEVAWCLNKGIYVPQSEFEGELDVHVPGITEK